MAARYVRVKSVVEVERDDENCVTTYDLRLSCGCHKLQDVPDDAPLPIVGAEWTCTRQHLNLAEAIRWKAVVGTRAEGN
jgi:hypothetical protein